MTQLSMLYSGVHVGRLYIAAELHKLLQAADSRLLSQCTGEKLLAAICVDFLYTASELVTGPIFWTRPDPYHFKIFTTRPDPTRPDPRMDPTRDQLWGRIGLGVREPGFESRRGTRN
jgi:hypothetical protein